MDRSALLSTLTSTAAQVRPEAPLMGRLCEAVRVVADADGASLSLSPAGDAASGRMLVWSTDDVAAELEQLHEVVGQGPATDALQRERERTVTARLDDATSPWPLFVESAARRTPALSLTAVPLRTDGGVLGVLALYRSRPGPLARDDEELGFLADLLAVAVVEGTSPGSAPAQAPWDDRSAINQAIGMVMAQLAVGADDATALLRAHAYAMDLGMADVAHQVLDRTLQLGPEGGR